MRDRPLAIDLFCGLGGWTEGLLAEGYDVIGFDIERHEYGDHCYPAQLVVQDVLTLHGSQFRSADLIVASPPCQAYSYMAMPWTKAKAKAAAIRADTTGMMLADLNRLFDACFRIQREACEAAGRHIPLVIENVKGAQPWVGRARWNFGSFYLWGDVPALMPIPSGRAQKFNPDGTKHGQGSWFAIADSKNRGHKSTGMDWSDPTKRGQDFTRIAGEQAIKNNGGSWFNIAHNTTSGKGQNPDGRKHHASGAAWFDTGPASLPSKSPRRKFASAMIAKIPLPLSRHIAATFRPKLVGRAITAPIADAFGKAGERAGDDRGGGDHLRDVAPCPICQGDGGLRILTNGVEPRGKIALPLREGSMLSSLPEFCVSSGSTMTLAGSGRSLHLVPK